MAKTLSKGVSRFDGIFKRKGPLVNVTVENLAPCKKLMRVEIESQDVDAAFESMIKDFQRSAALPGFRPGQALQFAATVETAPEFQLPEYKGLPVKRDTTNVTDEDVVRALDMLRGRQV